MRSLALLLTIAALVPAQEFEVASIRPATDDGHHSSDGDKGYYRVHNLTLKSLIAAAWDIDDSQVVGGPSWSGSDSWDINARIPVDYAAKRSQDQFRHMVRQLLADRFRLSIHRGPARYRATR